MAQGIAKRKKTLGSRIGILLMNSFSLNRKCTISVVEEVISLFLPKDSMNKGMSLGMKEYGNSKETKLNQYMIMAASLFHVSDWIETKETKNLEGQRINALLFKESQRFSTVSVLYLGIILHGYKLYNPDLYNCFCANCTETLYYIS